MIPAFYPILDTGCGLAALTAAEAILEAGARILQYRHKGIFSREVFEEAGQIAALCGNSGALFVMNDRADIAMLLDAALHLGQDDLPPADARRIMPSDRVIGFSTHSTDQLRAGDREPIDYLAIGPIFATASKENPDPTVGIERLRKLRPLTQKPLVAIGGITRKTAAAVFEAGADSVAIIGDLYPQPLTRASLRQRAEEWLSRCADHEASPLL
jgi:thiamine-phosphate pyrophosphorylase